MKVLKVLNNNFVLVKDGSQELIVGGKGIGFSKKCNDIIDEKDVNQMFIIPSNDRSVSYIEHLESQYLELAINIMDFAKMKINTKLNESSILAIADHIQNAVERKRNNIEMPNYLVWEIKHFYPIEYEVGEYAIKIINNQLNILLSEDEIGNIASHIIDSQLESSNIKQVSETAKLIKEICNVVKYNFNQEFDVESIYYYRFITHLKFFANRLFNDLIYSSTDQSSLYEVIKTTYPNSFSCSEKIAQLLKTNYSYILSNEELIYLTIHIENVVYKSKNTADGNI